MIVMINQTRTAMFNVSNFNSITVMKQDNNTEDEFTVVIDQSAILGVYKGYMIPPLFEWIADNFSKHNTSENMIFTMPRQEDFPTEEEVKNGD